MAIKASMPILLLDNDTNKRKFTKNMFIDMGLKNVKEASDLNKSKDLLQEFQQNGKPVGLIVAKWDPEECEGLDLVSYVKSEETYKNIPIIMITNQSDQISLIKCLKAGVNAVVVPPYSALTLKEKLAKIFNKKKAA